MGEWGEREEGIAPQKGRQKLCPLSLLPTPNPSPPPRRGGAVTDPPASERKGEERAAGGPQFEGAAGCLAAGLRFRTPRPRAGASRRSPAPPNCNSTLPRALGRRALERVGTASDEHTGR